MHYWSLWSFLGKIGTILSSATRSSLNTLSTCSILPSRFSIKAMSTASSRSQESVLAAFENASGELGDSFNKPAESQLGYSTNTQDMENSKRASTSSRRASRSGSKNRSSSKIDRGSESGAGREIYTRRREKRNSAHASSSSLPPLPNASQIGLDQSLDNQEQPDLAGSGALNLGSMMSIGSMHEAEPVVRIVQIQEEEAERKVRKKKEKREHKRQVKKARVRVPVQNIPDMIEVYHPETSMDISGSNVV
jgi:hypothetical protein